MDFELTDEQRLVRETARAFTDNEIVERARENDRNEHFDLELVGKIADQGYLGTYILTSALKRVDTAVFNAIKNDMAGQFTPGGNVTNDIANGGIGYGRIGPAGLTFAPQIQKIYDQIKSGQISNIPDTVK